MKINEVTASLINNNYNQTALHSDQLEKLSEVENILILLTYKFINVHVDIFLLAGFLYAKAAQAHSFIRTYLIE